MRSVMCVFLLSAFISFDSVCVFYLGEEREIIVLIHVLVFAYRDTVCYYCPR